MYIKRFESVLEDDDLESCKDYIETLEEFEENLEISGFKEGYYNDSKVSNELVSEKSPRALQFFLKLKDTTSNLYNDVSQKSDFDKHILLTQRAKYLYTKFEIHCKKISIEIRGSAIKFLLLFDNKDESEKRRAKINRIYTSFEKHFTDYANSKTFYVYKDKENFKLIIDEIVKDDYKLGVIINGGYSFEFRFSVDIKLDNDIIEIRPKSFRYKVDYSSTGWKTLKSNKKLIEFTSDRLSKTMMNDGWEMKHYKISNDVDVKVENGTIKVKIK